MLKRKVRLSGAGLLAGFQPKNIWFQNLMIANTQRKTTLIALAITLLCLLVTLPYRMKVEQPAKWKSALEEGLTGICLFNTIVVTGEKSLVEINDFWIAEEWASSSFMEMKVFSAGRNSSETARQKASNKCAIIAGHPHFR